MGTPRHLRSLHLDRRLITLLNPSAFEAEQYRRLRHRVAMLKHDGRNPVIAVTSAAADEGKTVTAINLAATLAEAPDTRVLLVDTDLRRPAVSRHFSRLDGEADGLAVALTAPGDLLASSVRVLPGSRLSVLTAATRQDGTYETLASRAFADLLAEARRRFDFVVLDAAPLLAVPDGLALQPLVDGFIIVVAAKATPRRLLGEALGTVDEDKLLGLVFNRDDGLPLGNGYYRQHVRSYAETPGITGR